MAYSKEQIKANRKLWIDALRSGKFTQGKFHLNKNDKFCCLGVACEIAKTRKICKSGPIGTYDGQKCLLPKSVQEWLDISDDGFLSRPVRYANDDNPIELVTLQSLNDYGTDFLAIAKIIEEGLLKPRNKNEDKET